MIPRTYTLALIILALALALPPAPHQLPAAALRCTNGALMQAATTPPTYARCTGGKWRAITAKDYGRLTRGRMGR